MKKISLILLTGILCLGLSACGKNNGNNWNGEEGQISEVIEKSDEDLNLTGELYTEKNKPEGSEKIIIYNCDPKELKLTSVESYALPEKLNAQYLLDIISVYCTNNSTKFTSNTVADMTTVNINNGTLLGWMGYVYEDDAIKYNIPTEGRTDFIFNAPGFEMTAFEAIFKTLKENLDIENVVFKTNNDQEFYKISNSEINNGIFFTPDGMPLYYASEYNYFDGKNFEELKKEMIEAGIELPENKEEQIQIVSNYVNSIATGPKVENTEKTSEE